MRQAGLKRPRHGYMYEYLGREVVWDGQLQAWRDGGLEGRKVVLRHPAKIGRLVRKLEQEIRPGGVIWEREHEAIVRAGNEVIAEVMRQGRPAKVKPVLDQFAQNHAQAVLLCKERMRKEYRKDKGMVARYCTAKLIAGRIKVEYHTGPCHSTLNRIDGKVLALVTAPSAQKWMDKDDWTGGRHDEEDYPKGEKAIARGHQAMAAWWRWLTVTGRYKHAFEEELHPLTAAEEGISINLENDAYFNMVAIIGTREPYEYPNRVIQWYEAVRKGGDRLVLSVLMEGMTNRGGLRMGTSGGIHDMYRGSSFNAGAWKKFLANRKGGNGEAPPAKNGLSFYGVHDYYAGDNNGIAEVWHPVMKLPEHARMVNHFDIDTFQIVKRKDNTPNPEKIAQHLADQSNEIRRKYGKA